MKLISCKYGEVKDKTISCVPSRYTGLLIPVSQDLIPYGKVKVTLTPLSGGFNPSDFAVALKQKNGQYSNGTLKEHSTLEINKPFEMLFDISKTEKNNAQLFRLYFSRTGDKTDPLKFKIDKVEFLNTKTEKSEDNHE